MCQPNARHLINQVLIVLSYFLNGIFVANCVVQCMTTAAADAAAAAAAIFDNVVSLHFHTNRLGGHCHFDKTYT